VYESISKAVECGALQKWVVIGHIRAEGCNVERARERVRAHMKWRETLVQDAQNDWKFSEFL